ncbi:MAG: PAS domain S-box protein [Pseudomonadota bacterium]
MAIAPDHLAMRRIERATEAYESLFGDAELAVFVLAEGIVDCNGAACRLLDYPRDALVGRSPLDFAPPFQSDGTDSATAARERVAAALAGLPQSFQWQFRSRDGTPVEALLRLEAIRLDGTTRLLLQARNLSHLWRAEQALRDTQARLTQILDNANALVFAKDRQGRYLFANRRFQCLLRRREHEILGHKDEDLFGPEMARHYRASDLNVLDAGEAQQFEETARLPDGVHTYVSVKFPLLDSGGAPYAVCGIATDITDRKRVEDALRDAALAVSTAEGDAVFRELARYLAAILDVDVTFIARFGAHREAMRTLALWVDGALQDNIEYDLEGTPCRLVVGREFQFFPDRLTELFPADNMFARLGVRSYAAFPLSDAGGQALGLVAVVSRRPLANRPFVESVLKIFAARAAAEIDRQRADEARRRSEASYRSIFEASEDAIFIHDWDTGAIVDVNQRACRMYGYSREEMLRLRVGDLSSGEHPYTEAEAARWIEKAKQGERVQVEWRRRNKDGSLHWDEVILCKADIAGRPHVLAITREITERKQAEEQLRDSEERYRLLFEMESDAIILADAGTLQHIDANRAATDLYGYSREELLRLRSTDLSAEPEKTQTAMHMGEGTVRVPLRYHRRKDGSVFPVEITANFFALHGRRIMLAAIRDITERKRAEEERGRLESQLRQAQKMEAIGHLTGGIAHDFNNILTSVMGYIALAADRSDGLGDDRIVRYLDQARSSCTRARDLIQQMLTFSRGQRGEPRPLRLAPLVRESVKLLRSSLPATIDIVTEVDEGAPPVLLDPVQLDQVLLNLCINARDAMGDGGRITVSVDTAAVAGGECTACRGGLDGRFVAMTVSDTGHGITPDVLDRMFEPFFSTKEVGKGSGMGLSTVHGIVHEHGGHILVTSAPGAGARFRVLLPALAGADAGAGAAGTAQPPVRARRLALRGRVLVAEDEPAVAEFMRDLLES